MKDYRSSHFDLKIKRNKNNTDIDIILKGNLYKTSQIPKTYSVIKENLPEVLTTKCINQKDLPFSEEIKDTEIAHLFEHILLENLYQLKISFNNKACFKGETFWNWHKERRGLYHISVDCCQDDQKLLTPALEKSIKLLRRLL